MKRKTILANLTTLLLILFVLFSVISACGKNNSSHSQNEENTPEFSGVFSAEGGKFYMDGGDVYTTDDGKLSLSLNAVLTEEYYNELKIKYGNNCELSFYATAGKVIEENPQIIAENKTPPVSMEFSMVNDVSALKVNGKVIIDGYNFTGAEYFAFFDEGYFGRIFLAVKYSSANGKTTYDKITAYGEENFEEYSDKATNIKISQFNVYNLMMPTNKSFTLVEDIDLSKINYLASDKTFSGVFDGQGYSIKNLKPKARYDGLFCTLGEGAEIKNVAFIDVDLSHGEISGVFGQTNKNVTFSNVFVVVSSSFLGTGSGFIGEVSGGEQMYENLFIYSKATTSSHRDKTGLLVGRCYRSNNAYISNCHFIANFSCYNANNDGLFGDDYSDGVYNEPNFKSKNYEVYTNVNQLNLDKNSTLSNFIKNCIVKYINN